MKSLKRRFDNIAQKNAQKNLGWSPHTCLLNAIRDRRFSKQVIHRWFNILVPKDDYDKKEKKACIDHLVSISNPLRTTGNEDKQVKTEGSIGKDDNSIVQPPKQP